MLSGAENKNTEGTAMSADITRYLLVVSFLFPFSLVDMIFFFSFKSIVLL